MRKLTRMQKKFARERAKGKSYAEAYGDAGYGSGTSEENKRKNAYKLENVSASADMIKSEIARLQKLADEGAIAERRHRQAILTEILLNSEEATADRLRASDQLARMSGDYTDRIQTENITRLSYADRLEAMRTAEE